MLQTVRIAMTLRALIDEARALLRRNGGVRSLLNLSSALLNTILKSIVVPLVVIAFISLHQVHAKPFTFNFPVRFSLASLVSGAGGGAGGVERRATAGVKPYTGLRVSNETLRMIYWFDQTVAVVELGPEKLLLNCELIEVFDDADGKRLLEQLSKINRPLEITFEQMMKLMQQCQQVLPSTVEGVERLRVTRAEGAAARAQLDAAGQAGGGILAGGSPLSLLSGIIPGTKWCGTGDIATTYHDLGADKRMDRCCRTHDLCPTKVRAFSKRYNLTNNSLYSKSHCLCDDVLFSCLKATNTSASEVMGNIYFNLVQVPCLEEAPSGDVRFRRAKQGF